MAATFVNKTNTSERQFLEELEALEIQRKRTIRKLQDLHAQNSTDDDSESCTPTHQPSIPKITMSLHKQPQPAPIDENADAVKNIPHDTDSSSDNDNTNPTPPKKAPVIPPTPEKPSHADAKDLPALPKEWIIPLKTTPTPTQRYRIPKKAPTPSTIDEPSTFKNSNFTKNINAQVSSPPKAISGKRRAEPTAPAAKWAPKNTKSAD